MNLINTNTKTNEFNPNCVDLRDLWSVRFCNDLKKKKKNPKLQFK